MKKLRFLCLLPICLLTSCDIHFGDVHYDVPWWVIAVVVLPVVFIIFVIAGRSLAQVQFSCPKCGGTFRPSPWKALLSLHMGDHRVLRCPHCGEKSMCPPSHGRDDR